MQATPPYDGNSFGSSGTIPPRTSFLSYFTISNIRSLFHVYFCFSSLLPPCSFLSTKPPSILSWNFAVSVAWGGRWRHISLGVCFLCRRCSCCCKLDYIARLPQGHYYLLDEEIVLEVLSPKSFSLLTIFLESFFIDGNSGLVLWSASVECARNFI